MHTSTMNTSTIFTISLILVTEPTENVSWVDHLCTLVYVNCVTEFFDHTYNKQIACVNT